MDWIWFVDFFFSPFFFNLGGDSGYGGIKPLDDSVKQPGGG